MKAQILADIKEAEKIGLKVQPGSFGNQQGLRCCPMTAVAIAQAGPNAISDKDYRFREELVMPAVCLRLGVDKQWVLGFIQGYDSMNESLWRPARSKTANYKAGFNLGREIRKEK